MFELVPQHLGAEIGVMTGWSAWPAAGGLWLASSLGVARQFAGAFLVFAALAVLALAGPLMVKCDWRAPWSTAARV